MSPEEQILKAVQELQKLSDIFLVSVKKNQRLLLDLNDKQMEAGEFNTGEKITPKYTRIYALKKGFTTPNLKVKGDFYRSKTVEVKADSINYGATVDYAVHLENKYGKDKMYGTNERNTNEIVVPKWLEPVNKKLEDVTKKYI